MLNCWCLRTLDGRAAAAAGTGTGTGTCVMAEMSIVIVEKSTAKIATGTRAGPGIESGTETRSGIETGMEQEGMTGIEAGIKMQLQSSTGTSESTGIATGITLHRLPLPRPLKAPNE
jgi:hypothetical protein